LTIASQMVSRRALLAAGAGSLLAACGPPEQAAQSRQEVLNEQLRVTRLAIAAGAARARARANKLEAAGAVAGPVSAPSGPRNAYEAEGRALASYVAAVGALRQDRKLLGELVADAAASRSELARRLGLDPLPSAFPGESA
jgi:hypothetical protein